MSTHDDEKQNGGHVLPCGHVALDPQQVHYCDYIGLSGLEKVAAPHHQGVAREPCHPDERLFVQIHQAIELKFMLHIDALRRAVRALGDDGVSEFSSMMGRLTQLIKSYLGDMEALKTMPPASFAAFRDHLAPASGAESEAFRIIEVLSGLTATSPYGEPHPGCPFTPTFKAVLTRNLGKGHGLMEAQWWTPRIEAALFEKSLTRAFTEALYSHGFLKDPDGAAEEVRDVIATIPKEHFLAQIVVLLHSYERQFLALRVMHLVLARHQIGAAPGTGNTSGVSYLASVVRSARFFPFIKTDTPAGFAALLV